MISFLDRFFGWLVLGKIRPHIPEGAVLCDVGCGPHAQLLRDLAGYIKWGVGLDKKVEEASLGNISLKAILVDDELPLPDKSMDVVTLLAVLEHLEKPAEVLKEIKRILKDGGTLLITVPTPFNKPFGEFLAYRLHLIDEAEYRDHKRYYSKRLLREHLAEAGFDLSKVKMNYFELGMNLFAKISV